MNNTIRLIIASLYILIGNEYSDGNESKKTYILKQVSEIDQIISTDGDNLLWSVSDICCDRNNRLYVADSGWNRVFIYDQKGINISSFGNAGQGPGEFLARPIVMPLKIDIGNDERIYITDLGNRRINVFKMDGQYIATMKIPSTFRDKAHANSKGDIIMAYYLNGNVIHVHDGMMQEKKSFMESKSHMSFPLYSPKRKIPLEEGIPPLSLQVSVTKNDQIIVLSNISLKILLFNEKYENALSFRIDNEAFLNNYRKRLNTAIKQNRFIFPFMMHLDDENRIYLSYYNDVQKKFEIYIYDLFGNYIGIMKFIDDVVPVDIAVDALGNIYVISADRDKILVFQKQMREGGS